MPALQLHPDRLLPSDPATRVIARQLYDVVRQLPILSPHGHVEASLLLDDEAFRDPASLLITPDHYVKRLLHANGVGLERLGVGVAEPTEDESRAIWRTLCAHWPVFRGTPVAYWFESELAEIFGVSERPSEASADTLYDQVAACLEQPEFRPRALFDRFGIEVLATTDDPADDLAAHASLAADPTFHGRVLPTFRPDRYLEPGRPGWRAAVESIADEPTSCAGFIAALAQRRAFFVDQGGTSADHSHVDLGSEPLSDAEAERIHRAAYDGRATADDATAYRRHLLFEMARMSTEDGLVMTLHPGIRRNHHRPTLERFGPDQGHDLPLAMEYTDALRPILERFGLHPDLHLVLFTVDETVFSREIAPLAGFYPSVYVGAPWWFLDAPDAIRRWRSAVTETVGFSKLSGFVDDTRAFCSIPARHDMARRLDAGYLAQLVVEHRLAEDEAHEAIRDLVDSPRRVFKL
ncbi:glucuronate isomerase [Nocardioides sp. Root1257]|uniref:glucuronate isomerase n=1 Tax=unclassified Nocardioides TaxID=2615069 RepID=UPI0006F5DA9F|nr:MULTISPECIES: glucuronate isomerase [unclassified Nocardioides]KQW47268.1 glucuronate isomerase [Nocardioides sp. Root1257]KRC45424.1 glucuronate isomerase [Nocardioides sp. Root224]